MLAALSQRKAASHFAPSSNGKWSKSDGRILRCLSPGLVSLESRFKRGGSVPNSCWPIGKAQAAATEAYRLRRFTLTSQPSEIT